MNIRQTLKTIAQNPKDWEILIEQINEVAADYNFNQVRTFNQVVFFCENYEIGEEFLYD